MPQQGQSISWEYDRGDHYADLGRDGGRKKGEESRMFQVKRAEWRMESIVHSGKAVLGLLLGQRSSGSWRC